MWMHVHMYLVSWFYKLNYIIYTAHTYIIYHYVNTNSVIITNELAS